MYQDLTGQRYGKLTVIEYDHKDVRGKAYWKCRCDCGNMVVSRSDSLKSGNANSCGCLKDDMLRERSTVHGYCKGENKQGNATYRSWHAMNQRCRDPKADQYPDYGGRGIKVCDRWIHSFQSFVDDMGERPDGMTIDRIDHEGDYEPSNCRWATAKQQNNNTRANHFITLGGRTKTISQWSREFGIPNTTVYSRIKMGWPEQKLFQPVMQP